MLPPRHRFRALALVTAWSVGTAAVGFLGGRLTALSDTLGSVDHHVSASLGGPAGDTEAERPAACAPDILAEARRRAQTEAPSAWQWALALGSADPGHRARQAVLETWVATDPMAAAGARPIDDVDLRTLARHWPPSSSSAAAIWLRRLQPEDRFQALAILTDTWTEREAPAALRCIEQALPAAERPRWVRAVMLGWSARDPHSAWTEMQRREELRADPDLAQAVLVAWARCDPSRALAAANDLASGPTREATLHVSLAALARENPEAALNFVRQSKSASESIRLLSSVTQAVVNDDPELAALLATALPPGLDHAPVLASVAGALAADHAEQALAWVQRLPPGAGRRAAFRRLGVVRGDQDPAQAARWALQLSDGDGRLDALSAITAQWHQRDPEAATQWLVGLPEGSTRNAMIADLARTLAGSAGRAAARLVCEGLPPGENRNGVLGDIADSWTRGSPDEAIRFMDTLEDRESRQAFAGRLLPALAERDPARAAALAARHLDPAVSETTLHVIVERWAGADPRTAANWVIGFPSGSLRENALRCVAGNWAESDPIGAVAWLRQLPADVARDQALQTCLTTTAQHAPALAAAWVGEIRDRDVRIATILSLSRRWRTSDAPAAATWLARQGLPEDVYRRMVSDFD